MKSSDDLIYEQDILRDPTSVKPWLGYIDFKHQHGSLLEQTFVWQSRRLPVNRDQDHVTEILGHGTRLHAPTPFVQIMEDGNTNSSMRSCE